MPLRLRMRLAVVNRFPELGCVVDRTSGLRERTLPVPSARRPDLSSPGLSRLCAPLPPAPQWWASLPERTDGHTLHWNVRTAPSLAVKEWHRSAGRLAGNETKLRKECAAPPVEKRRQGPGRHAKAPECSTWPVASSRKLLSRNGAVSLLNFATTSSQAIGRLYCDALSATMRRRIEVCRNVANLLGMSETSGQARARPEPGLSGVHGI